MKPFVVSKKSQKVEKILSVLMLGIFICEREWFGGLKSEENICD